VKKGHDVFQSGFHRWAFFYGIASIAVWFYALNEWWGTVAAIILCVPVGVVFCVLPPMVVGTLRQVLGDAIVTWASIVGGLALGVYAVIGQDGPVLALLLLTGAGFVLGGIGFADAAFERHAARRCGGPCVTGGRRVPPRYRRPQVTAVATGAQSGARSSRPAGTSREHRG
jgi:hypothetical protein